MHNNELSYAFDFAQRAQHSSELEPVDPVRAGQYPVDLKALYEAHLEGGPARARVVFQQLLESPLGKASDLARRYLPVTPDELSELPPPQWLIPDILPKRSLCVLYGEPEQGKSFLALHVALRLARTQRVIYVAAEGKSGYVARVKAHQSVYGDSPELRLVFSELNLFDRLAVDRFIMEYEREPPTLLVIDTLASSILGADENSSKDMGLVISGCRDLIRALNATVLLVHHTTKSGDTERGSSSLRGAADVMMHMKTANNRATLKCT